MQETLFAARIKDSAREKKPYDTSRNSIREQLVQKAVQGDAEALASLMESVTKTVLYYTTSTLRSRMDAEDATQEVMVRVFTKIGDLKSPQKFNAWLKTIIVNETRRYMLKNYTRNELDISEHPDIEDMNDNALPHVSAERNERSEAVIRSVGNLTERQREAVYSVHYLGLSVKDTAKAMGIKSQSVNDNLKLAYKKIERELHAEGMVSAYGAGLLPLGAEISKVLLHDAEIFTIQNAGWVAKTVAQCGLLIKGAAALGAGAGAGVSTAGAGVAASTAGAGSASTAAVAATAGAMHAIITPVICVAAAMTVTTVTLGVNQYVQDRAPQESEYEVVVQPGPVATDGGIIFSGGDESEHINPQDAVVWLTDELIMLGWQITPVGSNEVLFSGESSTVGNALTQMRESGMDGRYVILFSMGDEAGGYYTVDREFVIRSPQAEDQDPAPVAKTDADEDVDAESDAEAVENTDADDNTDADAEADADTDIDEDAEADAETNAEADEDVEAGAEADPETDTDESVGDDIDMDAVT